MGGVIRRFAFLALCTSAAPLSGQAPSPIEDNSFLIEEAYNQEAGVVQHISLLTRERNRSWAYGFTQGWPFRGQRHQFSYTLSLLHHREPGTSVTGLGDLLFNYRLQWKGREGSRLWVAPRLSAILPSGRWRDGLGDGVLAFQFALPASLQLTPRLVVHLNASFTLSPSARATDGARATLTTLAGGGSAIFHLRPTVDLMLESVVESAAEVVAAGTTARTTTMLLNPGIRWAHNLKSGLQIVPGVAWTVGLGDAAERSGPLLYLSFEHPFRKLQ